MSKLSFQQTIVDYNVEIVRHRRLLDIPGKLIFSCLFTDLMSQYTKQWYNVFKYKPMLCKSILIALMSLPAGNK